MNAKDLLRTVIIPTCELIGSKFSSREAEIELLAIALQESRLKHRIQQPSGPAHGLWQFELVAVRDVLTHPATKIHAKWLCEQLLYRAYEVDVYAAIVHNDMLACGLARLLLYRDPQQLPKTEIAGWDYYLRCWRPGKPHPGSWAANYAQAVVALDGGL